MIIKLQQRLMKVNRYRIALHRSCSFCILDIENSPIPEYPPHQVVVGVISMEDVIEELLKEEILDETDEYVNIHNRIKVNMSVEKLPTMNSLQQAFDASSASRSAGEPAGTNPGPSTTQ